MGVRRRGRHIPRRRCAAERTRHVLEQLRIYCFSGLSSEKGASKFGNWERVESDWTESQDSYPGILKGPSNGWRRLQSMGGWAVGTPPPPSGMPLALRRFDLEAPRSCRPGYPRCPHLSGIRSFYPGPSTVSVNSSNKHLFSEHLVCAKRFAQDFSYCPT